MTKQEAYTWMLLTWRPALADRDCGVFLDLPFPNFPPFPPFPPFPVYTFVLAKISFKNASSIHLGSHLEGLSGRWNLRWLGSKILFDIGPIAVIVWGLTMSS